MPHKNLTIPEKIRNNIVAGATIPSMADLVEHYFEICGGPRQFAKDLYQEYQKAPVGGMARARILDIIVTMTGKLKDAGGEDLGLLSDDDLLKSLEEVTSKMLKNDVAQETS